MSFVSVPRTRHPPVLLQVLTALAGGLLLFLLVTGLITGGYRLLYTGRIFPGISMAGVDLTSMTPEQATAAISQQITFPANGRIVLRDEDRLCRPRKTAGTPLIWITSRRGATTDAAAKNAAMARSAGSAGCA